MCLDYESTLLNPFLIGKSKMESIGLDDSSYRPVASGGACAPPLFGRSVNPISTRGCILSPPSTMCPPRFSDLATALSYESTLSNLSTKGKSKMESIDLDDSGYESTSPKRKSKIESIGLDDSDYESTLSNHSTKGKSKMEPIDLDDSGYESTSPNVSPKRNRKIESIDFWFKKPTPEEKSISKCFIKTENEVEYSIVETNPCKKKNGKYSASESFDDSNSSETSKSGKILTNPNHYVMPKGYSPPAPECLPVPPSSWLTEIELTSKEICEMSNGFESTKIPTTFDSLLLQPSSFTN